MSELKFPFKFRAFGSDPIYTARSSGEDSVQISWYNFDGELRSRMYNLSDVARYVSIGVWVLEDPEQCPKVAITQDEYDSLIDEINMLRDLIAEITLETDYTALGQQASTYRALNEKMLKHHSYKQGDGGSTREGELLEQLDTLFAAYDSLASGVTKQQTFKPISEMTLEDWRQALFEGALFEHYDGSTLTVSEVSTIGFEPRIGFQEHAFLFSEDGSNLESGYRIKRRIK